MSEPIDLKQEALKVQYDKHGNPLIPCDQDDCRYCKVGYCVGFLCKDAVCPNLTAKVIEEFGL